ncbi:hypothetical protein ACSU1N_00580 [Thermogladius sp. 4427co]|uniref:hypothetical protein n=1 Tax=Thermogladius sp. 4427co TaxID=3450718 RepID=UPI003F7A7B7B
MFKTWKIYTLERELGWFEIFLWVVANPIASGFIIFTIQMLGSPGFYGGSNTLAYLLSSLLYVPIVLAFMYISLNIQKPASPYVLISRVISPVVGYLAMWYYIVASGGLLSMGFLVYYGIRALGANILYAGLVNNDEALVNTGIVLNQPIVELYLGVLVIVLLFFLSTVSTRSLKWVLASMVIPPLIATIVFTVLFYLADTSQLYSNLALALGTDPISIERLALSGGGGINPLQRTTLLAGSLSMMVATLWAYMGIESASFVAGEVRDPVKSYSRGYTLGYLTVVLLYLLVPYIVESKLGVDLVASYSYLYYNYQEVLTRYLGGRPLIPPTLFVFLSLISRDKIVSAIAGVTAFLWFLNTAYTTWLAAVRILYALSTDKLASASLARVTGFRGIPIVANNVVFLFGLIGLLLGYASITGLLPLIALLKLFNFGYSILVWLVGVSLAVLPWLKKDLFESMPFKMKGLETVVGVLCFAAGWFMLLYSGIGITLGEVIVNTLIGVLGFAILVATLKRGGVGA